MSVQKLRVAFPQHFAACEHFEGALTQDFARKNVLEPLCTLIEFHAPPDTSLLNVSQSKKVVGGVKTPNVHVQMQTPYSPTQPITQGYLGESLEQNLPPHTQNFVINFDPLTQSFLWELDFSFDRKTIEQLSRPEQSMAATAAAAELATENQHVLQNEDKEALLEQRRRLERDSKAAEIVLSRRRTRRVAHKILNGDAPPQSSTATNILDDDNSAPTPAVKPLKIMVVPRKSNNGKPAAAIAKSGSKLKAKAGGAVESTTPTPAKTSWRNSFFQKIVHLVAGVDASSDKSSDYVAHHQYDSDLFMVKN
jgi:hypothetical protein